MITSKIKPKMVKLNTTQYIKGIHGKAIIDDCIKWLKKLKPNAFDLCITGIPYPDNGYHRDIKRQKHTKTYSVMDNYDLSKKNDVKEYMCLVKDWWKLIKRVSKVSFIQCGYNLMKYWHHIDDFDPWFWYNTSKNGGDKSSTGLRLEPFLIHNIKELDQLSQRMQINPFNPEMAIKYCYHSGEYDFKNDELIHPHPTASWIYEYIITRVKPNNVIDPFLGSGTLGQVCEYMGIKWIGFERNSMYRKDIYKRLQKGMCMKAGYHNYIEAKNRKKQKKVKSTSLKKYF